MGFMTKRRKRKIYDHWPIISSNLSFDAYNELWLASFKWRMIFLDLNINQHKFTYKRQFLQNNHSWQFLYLFHWAKQWCLRRLFDFTSYFRHSCFRLPHYHLSYCHMQYVFHLTAILPLPSLYRHKDEWRVGRKQIKRYIRIFTCTTGDLCTDTELNLQPIKSGETI